MELEEIIAWIKIKMEQSDQTVLYYKCCNDDVGAGLFYEDYIRYKNTLEYLKELQDRRAGILNDDRRSD